MHPLPPFTPPFLGRLLIMTTATYVKYLLFAKPLLSPSHSRSHLTSQNLSPHPKKKAWKKKPTRSQRYYIRSPDLHSGVEELELVVSFDSTVCAFRPSCWLNKDRGKTASGFRAQDLGHEWGCSQKMKTRGEGIERGAREEGELWPISPSHSP